MEACVDAQPFPILLLFICPDAEQIPWLSQMADFALMIDLISA